jgi:transglutaminase-like putative cysteine protease
MLWFRPKIKKSLTLVAAVLTFCLCGSISGIAATVAGSGIEKNEKATIDYSATTDGYIRVQYTGNTQKRLKVKVKGPATEYIYDILPGENYTFSLSDGNGAYKVTVFENVSGQKYANVLTAGMDVKVKDEFAPFLCSNQFVDYQNAPKSVKLAQTLCKGKKDLDMVAAVYDYVVGDIVYDQELAVNVKAGYLPVLDDVLTTRKGICFDYGALMAGMLRSQKVPCKLVVGYAGTAYHAWIDVWTKETGWITEAIKFDGSKWTRMDPTFASSANSSDDVMKFIGDGTNYTAKYYY